MVKLLLKLAIAGLLINAAYRIGGEYVTYISFRDEVRDAAMYKAKTDAELSRQIMDLADQYDVPLAESALKIVREERRVRVEGAYEKPIEVVPTYFYPWHFAWSIDATVSIVIPPFTPRPQPRRQRR